jgi:hypothetical protein
LSGGLTALRRLALVHIAAVILAAIAFFIAAEKGRFAAIRWYDWRTLLSTDLMGFAVLFLPAIVATLAGLGITFWREDWLSNRGIFRISACMALFWPNAIAIWAIAGRMAQG